MTTKNFAIALTNANGEYAGFYNGDDNELSVGYYNNNFIKYPSFEEASAEITMIEESWEVDKSDRWIVIEVAA